MMQFFRKCLLGVSFVTALLWGQGLPANYYNNNLDAPICVDETNPKTIKSLGGLNLLVYALNPAIQEITINNVGDITIQANAPAGTYVISYGGVPFAKRLIVSNPATEPLAYDMLNCTLASEIRPTNPLAVGIVSSSPAGLIIDPNTGVIQTSNSVKGVRYTITNIKTDGACSIAKTTPIEFPNYVEVKNAANFEFCEIGSITLDRNILQSNIGINTFSILLPNGNTINPLIDEQILVNDPSLNGTWTLTALSGNLNQCLDVHTFNVILKPAPQKPALLKFENCEVSREIEFDILRYTIVQPGEIGDLTWERGGGNTNNGGILTNATATLVPPTDPNNKVKEWVITIPVDQPFTTMGGNFNIINTITTNPPLAGCTTIPSPPMPFNLTKQDLAIQSILPNCSGDNALITLTAPAPADLHSYGFVKDGEDKYTAGATVAGQVVSFNIPDPDSEFANMLVIDGATQCKFSVPLNLKLRSINGWDGRDALKYSACVNDELNPPAALPPTPYTYGLNTLFVVPMGATTPFYPTPLFDQGFTVVNSNVGHTSNGVVLLPGQDHTIAAGATFFQNNKPIAIGTNNAGSNYLPIIGTDIHEGNGEVSYNTLLTNINANPDANPNGYNIYSIPYVYGEEIQTPTGIRTCQYDYNATLYVGPRRVPDAGRVWIGEVGKAEHDFSNGYDAVTGLYGNRLGDYTVTQEPGKYTNLSDVLRHQAGVYSVADYNIAPILDPADITKTVDQDKLKTKSSYEIELRDNVTTCGATHLATIEPRDIDKFFKLKSEIKQCFGDAKMAQEFFEEGLRIDIIDKITVEFEDDVVAVAGDNYQPTQKLDKYKSDPSKDTDIFLTFSVTDITGVKYGGTVAKPNPKDEINNSVHLIMLEEQKAAFGYMPTQNPSFDRDKTTILTAVPNITFDINKHQAPGAFWIKDPRFAGLSVINDVTGEIRAEDIFKNLQILKKGDESFEVHHRTVNRCDEDFTKLTFEVDIKTYDGFSPNGDDKNALFFIENIEFFPYLNIEVYNQNGDLLFRQAGYDNTWDGRVNQRQSAAKIGTKLDAGVYHYIIRKAEGYSPVIGTFEIRY
jgi:gliding motility-associated-like protein